MMRLYSGPLSIFTAKVRIALGEKGLTYDRIDVPFSRQKGYAPKHPEVVARNPKGQVPVLVDGDFSLYDSTLITEYLEDRYPEPALYPRDPVAKARCRQLELAADEIFFPPVLELIREVYYKSDATARDTVKIATATAAIRSVYAELDARLDTGGYLDGEFSVADVAYFVTTMFATNLGLAPDAAQANVHSWLRRVSERRAVAAEIDYIVTAAQQIAAAAPPS